MLENYSNRTDQREGDHHCGLHRLCPTVRGSKTGIRRIQPLLRHRRTLKRGEYLFRAGQALRSVYGICNGSLKSCLIAPDGAVQVLGFQLQHDVIGLSAISENQYISDAQALEATEVCEVSFDSLQQLAAEVSGMQAQMCRILASEILKTQEGMLLRSRKTAEEKLGGFLLSVAACFPEQNGSAYEFDLSMSRSDIGSYLGITAETVSRVFTQFQQKRLIELSRRHVILSDRERLSAIAGHVHSKPF